MKLYRIYEHGGLDQLKFEDAPAPVPGPGEVTLRQVALGVNFSDVQARIGGSIYAHMPLPRTPGTEGVGEVIALGAGVTRFKLGDMAAYPDLIGGYAEERAAPEANLVPLPAGVAPHTAAAIITTGMTAYVLAHKVRPGLNANHTALVHAGAGAVGLMLIQILKLAGVRVIATVSSEAKAAAARMAGADDIILYTREDFSAAARKLTRGAGVDVVFDGIGKDTFEQSLASLRTRGWMIMSGEASGPPPTFLPARLGRQGSIYLTRMLLNYYLETLEERLEIADAVFALSRAGKLQPLFCKSFAFDQAPQAQAALQGRESIGKMILIP